MITKPSSIITILGLLLATISVLGITIGDRLTPRVLDQPSPPSGRIVSFSDPSGDQLHGTYYASRTCSTGILLLEGFGSDQVTLAFLVSEFQDLAFCVFTFDFSGHGRSPGTLAFDNAATDRLAFQALSALDEFERLSRLPPENIYLLGHSLGARVALQAATLAPDSLAGLILLGTQVNLTTNVQSEFFTGTTDSDLSWIQALGPTHPPVPVLLISGEWDDILTPASAQLLYEKLGGSQAGFRRTLVILPALFHNYEPYSPRLVDSVKSWLGVPGASRTTSWRLLGWGTGFIGLLLAAWAGKDWVLASRKPEDQPTSIQVTRLPRFLWGKLLLWLAALPVAAILGSLFFFTPVPAAKPVFNLIYVGFIGGYGLLLLILYGRGKMPGTKGRLPFTLPSLNKDSTARSATSRSLLLPLVVTALALVLTAAFARTGWFTVPPSGIRLVWLLIFTPFTALGFWIGLHESRLLRLAGGKAGSKLVLNLIGLFPFFLYTLLMAAIGSLSGMLGGLQGLLILCLVLLFGDLVQALGQRPWLTAVCMSVLLYWLILPQGVLFG